MPNSSFSDRSPRLAESRDLQWMLAAGGGTLASLSLAATADASLVQITQSGNFVSAATGDMNLDNDLTGDAVIDVPSWSGSGAGSAFFGYQARIKTSLGAFLGEAVFSSSISVNMFAAVGANSQVDTMGIGPVTATGLVEITFVDADINGGNATNAVVQLIATATTNSAVVEISRIIFDDADDLADLSGVSAADSAYGEFVRGGGAAVPEASELALLAFGAGGLMAHRRRKRKTA